MTPKEQRAILTVLIKERREALDLLQQARLVIHWYNEPQPSLLKPSRRFTEKHAQRSIDVEAEILAFQRRVSKRKKL